MPKLDIPTSMNVSYVRTIKYGILINSVYKSII